MRHARELVRPGQNAGDKTQRDLHRLGSIGTSGPVREQPRQKRTYLAQMEKAPKGGLPRMGTELLPGGHNANGLFPDLELDCFGHRLVSTSRVAFALAC